MRALLAILAILSLAAPAAAQERVSFPTDDDGTIVADLYKPSIGASQGERAISGSGERGVVLVHGGRFNRQSWAKQAEELTKAGFRVLAIDLRGYGESTGPKQREDAPLHLDVLAAVRYLRKAGAKSVSVVGGSMGGWAAAEAAAQCEPGEIERVVLLGSTANDKPELLKGRKLFITCRDDLHADRTPRLTRIQTDFEKTPEPKELIVLDGSAHAQFIFQSDQGERAMREILRFLSAP